MKLKHFLVILLLLCIFIISSILSYSSQVFAGLQDNIFRLHILANSDSNEDQALKLLVRDAVINYIEQINNNSNSKNQTISNISSHLEEIQALSEQVIKKQRL